MTKGTTCEMHGWPLYWGYWCLLCNDKRNDARRDDARKSLFEVCVEYGYDNGECGQSLEDWLEERLLRLLELELETAP
jgi:hypothetical protein